MLPPYVALLRGINVGGKNKLPMKELVQLFVEAGCSDVQSYIQSGNVVFRADSQVAELIPVRVRAAIAERFGFDAPLLLRSTEQMHDIVDSNPFLDAGAPEEHLHVLFLADMPKAGLVDALDGGRSLPDAFAVRGREVYLWLPYGVARTKLTNAYFDSKLKTISTGRNWRTVIRLLEFDEGVMTFGNCYTHVRLGDTPERLPHPSARATRVAASRSTNGKGYVQSS